MPGTYLKPALTVTRSLAALSHDRQTRTMVQKVSCRACCQGIQLESSSISLSHRPCSLAVALHACFHGLALIAEVHVGVDIHREIFESADFKFPVSGRSMHSRIHTRVRNAVTLVWGSLRLAPIT